MKKVGASLSLGFESGAHGIISLMGKESVTKEEVTRALAGLFIKPIVGPGDGLVETMKNFNEEKNFLQRRGRRTLMRKLGGGFGVLPYDDKVSAAEEVVECGGTVEDKYIFHTLCCKELLILSENCVWLLDRESSENIWCYSYTDISHFFAFKNEGIFQVQLSVFSSRGLQNIFVQVEGPDQQDQIFRQLGRFTKKMGNA